MPDDIERQLADAEEAVAREVAAVFDELAAEIAEQLSQATEIVAARFSLSRIGRAWTARLPRIVRRLLGVAETAAAQAADDAGRPLPDGWDDLPGRHERGEPLPASLGSYVEATEHLLRAVGDRLTEAAVQELAEGLDAGEDTEQLRARLRAMFSRDGAQLGTVREERIARTEAARAWNAATLAAAEDVTDPGRPLVKQWTTRRDARVRDAHDAADGQIRLLDETFTVGGVPMRYPGDPTAPASLTVNCRCILRLAPERQAAAHEPQDSDPRADAARVIADAFGFGGADAAVLFGPDDAVARPPVALESQGASAAGFSNRREVMAAGGHTGAMIALVPAQADAERLALDGGEPVDELHCTLLFLGDADDWDDDQRARLIDALRTSVEADLPQPVHALAFGVNQWNPASDDPAWVYAVGDDPDHDSPDLRLAHLVARDAIARTDGLPEIPRQHSPWVAHTTAAYAPDTWPFDAMNERLGPVTYDRLRIAFAGDTTDIPLGSDEEAPPVETTAAAIDEPPVLTWSTPGDAALAYENTQTGDGRVFASGALFWEGSGPWPLQYADEMSGGHDGAELAGAIHEYGRDGDRITGSGVLYLTQRAGAEAAMLLAQGAPLGVSVDLDSVDIELVDTTATAEDSDGPALAASFASASVLRLPDSGGWMITARSQAEWTASAGGVMSRTGATTQVISGPGGRISTEAAQALFPGVVTAAAGDRDDPDGGVVVHSEQAGDYLIRITRGRVRGATLVAMPAFDQARIVLDDIDPEEPTEEVAAAGSDFERVIAHVCGAPVPVAAREIAHALGLPIATVRRHLARAAEKGRLVRISRGLYTGPSSIPEGQSAAADTEAFHGTQGRPSYRKYHPGARNPASRRRTQHANGGWLGSDRFTEEQHTNAMLDYQGRAYRDMNSLLRSGTSPQRATLDETRARISTLSDLIAIQEPFTEDRALYRGTRQLRLGLKPGDEFHDKGFASTSEDEDVAASMTGVGGSLFRIKAPSGTQALEVAALGEDIGEREVILPPGTKFRVIAANEPEDPTQRAVYDVEIINGQLAAAVGLSPQAARTVSAAASASLADRISDWEPGVIVVDRRASASSAVFDLPDDLEASAWEVMQQQPPMPAAWFREPTIEELPRTAVVSTTRTAACTGGWRRPVCRTRSTAGR
ncbi:ADP-ribosyltransferase [Streptomyces cellulosae]